MRDLKAKGIALTMGNFPRLPRCLLLFAILCVVLCVPPAFADTIDFVATGTYDPTSTPSPLSPSGGAFTLSFSEPTTVTSLDTTSIMISYTLDGNPCTTCFSTGEVQFFPFDPSGGQYGLFNVVLQTTDDTYLWQFAGMGQFYSASGTGYSLMPGTIAMDSSTPLSTIDDTPGSGSYSGTISSGSVTATLSTSTVPEPSSLLLLSSGLLSLGPLRRRFMRA